MKGAKLLMHKLVISGSGIENGLCLELLIHRYLKSSIVDKHGQTVTNKNNNINIIKAFILLPHIPKCSVFVS